MQLHHPTPDELDLPTVLHALSDPQRLRIVGSSRPAAGPAPAVPSAST